MPRDDHMELSVRDKVVQKMTRDGAELLNVTKDSSERISNRLLDGEIKKEQAPDTEVGGRSRESPETAADDKKKAKRQKQSQAEAAFNNTDTSGKGASDSRDHEPLDEPEATYESVIAGSISEEEEMPETIATEIRDQEKIGGSSAGKESRKPVRDRASGDRASGKKSRLKTSTKAKAFRHSDESEKRIRLKESKHATSLQEAEPALKHDTSKRKFILSDEVRDKAEDDADDNASVEAASRTEQTAEYAADGFSDKLQKKRLKQKSVRDANVHEQKISGDRLKEKSESSLDASGVKENLKSATRNRRRMKLSETKVSATQIHRPHKENSVDQSPRLKTVTKTKPSQRLFFDNKIREKNASADSIRSGNYNNKQHTLKRRLRFETSGRQRMEVSKDQESQGMIRQREYYGSRGRHLYDNTGSTNDVRLKENHGSESPESKGYARKSKKGKEVQKKRLKRDYASAYRDRKRGIKGRYKSGAGASAALEAIPEVEKGPVKTFFSKHKATILIAMFFFLVLLIIVTSIGSVSIMLMSSGESFFQSTYLSSDNEITSTNETYAAMEDALQNRIDRIPQDYPGYDEYRYDLDDFGYDPYVLTSYLTAVFKEYDLESVRAELQSLFDAQYTLSLTPITETRYDSDGDPYDWHVLKVTLRNNGLESVVTARMDEDQKKAYDLYQENYGNRSYLFAVTGGGGGGTGGGGAPAGLDYAPTDEALLDERFRGMITEAEKYLGYPYVWGGSSPATSFDCSGFVSWVINNSGNGWNVGRQTANGLVGCTARVSDPKPGDLIFFQGTYDTAGASHVGIVVDPEKKIMIHCGKPIQYASYDTNYWRQHFMSYGRLP